MKLNYNKVILAGHMTRDPELKYTASGAAVVSFGIATNRSFKRNDEWEEEVCFVDITAWGPLAERVTEYTSKGKCVFIEGRLKFSSWEGDGGTKRSKLDVTADRISWDRDNPAETGDVPF